MKNRNIFIFIFIFIAIVVVLAIAITAAKKFIQQPDKVCLFSSISGVVTWKGKPLANVEVLRTANYWNKDKYSDKTKTDVHGQFQFGPMFVHSRHISMSLNPIIFEKLIIVYKGKQYTGWDTMRGDLVLNSELGKNKPIPELGCDLSNKSSTKDIKYGGTVNGICQW